jgi:SHS2 domain-containing protein
MTDKEMSTAFYKIEEHTADLAIRLEADDLKTLFTNAGRALFDLMIGLDRIEEQTSVSFDINGENNEELLVNYLTELLYHFEVDGLIFARFELEWNGSKEIHVNAFGEPHQPDNHGFDTAIKAVTYHQLRVYQNKGRWHAFVIFDV